MMQKITKVVAFWALAILLFACNEEEFVTMNQKTGKLIVGGVEVSAIVGDMQSRATLENVPSGNEFTIMVKSEDGSFERTLEEGVFSCILPVGTYTVEAVYGEDKIATEKPYFYGNTQVDIKEGMTESVSVTASLQSAIIRAVMSEELLAQYKNYALWISEATNPGSDMESIDNDKDIFVPAGESYSLLLTGTNLLGDNVNTSWELKSLSPKTRYIVSCDADLPSFTFPEQAVTNAWSKFIYITPMTAENMTSHSEMSQQVMDNIVYEASADNGSTWIPAEYDSENEKWVIKDLQPSTAYTLRSRFGGVVSSNTQVITTENAQDVPNGGMEEWTNTQLYGGNASFSAAVYCDYCTGWATRNEKTTNGAEDASGGLGGFFPIGGNYGASWRWHSGTVRTEDKSIGTYAAEISTLAFYNEKLNGGYSRDNIFNLVKENGSSYFGYLLLGTYDLSSDSYTLGYSPFSSRPVSLSFDYKYAPVEGDLCIAYAKVYDVNHQEIASTIDFRSDAKDIYTSQTLEFIYSNLACEAEYIGVFFQSGIDTDISKMVHIHGDYNMSPYNQDKIVGSVLKIDNVKLNYDYE